MKLGKLALAAAAGALAVAPIAAQATVADRSAPLAGESEVGGDGTAATVIGLFGLLAIAVAIGSSGGDDNDPVSL